MSTVHAALAQRFAAPEWALVFEVADSTGFQSSRRADAVALSLWPSRGLEIHGIEVKVSRSDWLRELKDAAKSAAIQRWCDRWWVATMPGVVAANELPPTWGHLEMRGDKLIQRVAAPALEAEPISRGFLMALVRAVHDGTVPKRVLDELVDAKVAATTKAREERDAKRERQDVERLTLELTALKKAVADFEAASGVKIDTWRGSARVGAAVRLVLASPDGSDVRAGFTQALRGARGSLSNVLDEITRAEAEIAGLNVEAS